MAVGEDEEGRGAIRKSNGLKMIEIQYDNIDVCSRFEYKCWNRSRTVLLKFAYSGMVIVGIKF